MSDLVQVSHTSTGEKVPGNPAAFITKDYTATKVAADTDLSCPHSQQTTPVNWSQDETLSDVFVTQMKEMKSYMFKVTPTSFFTVQIWCPHKLRFSHLVTNCQCFWVRAGGVCEEP